MISNYNKLEVAYSKPNTGEITEEVGVKSTCLQVKMPISVTPDYISFYHSSIGIFQLFEHIFDNKNTEVLDGLEGIPILLSFSLTEVKGFSIPLLTINLTFFCNQDYCPVFEKIEEHLDIVELNPFGIAFIKGNNNFS